MKVLGLISGGKDSCFNLVECVANGHELVALGNLGPKPGVEELDSPLYQTVGHTSVKMIAEAFGLPFYIQTIMGDSVYQGAHYSEHKGDETEDLAELVKQVLEHHPDIQAISSGAVLSNYQRVRVENVCQRFGLTSLSYLWQRDQSELLDEMFDSGIKSIMIKVAGAGLRLRHLGLDVTSPDVREELNDLKEKFGLHPAGEGGEYETFTVDCPLFKKKINVIQPEKVLTSTKDDMFSTVAFLRIENCTLEDKPADECYPNIELAVTRPSMLDDQSKVLKASTIKALKSEINVKEDSNINVGENTYQNIKYSIHKTASTLVLGNVTAFNHSRLDKKERKSHLDDGLESNVTKEVGDCIDNVLGIIAKQNSEIDRNKKDGEYVLTSISLFLSKEYMRKFGIVNKAYGERLSHIVPPPVRAAVAVEMPQGVGCQIEAVAHYIDSKKITRDGLHVQGLSYWAPACIGPYSQAISVYNDTFISGQIAMDPANLSLVKTNDDFQYVHEAVLSLQHVKRVYKAVHSNSGSVVDDASGLDKITKGGICWVDGTNWLESWHAARETWLLSTKKSPENILFVGATLLPKNAGVEWQLVCNKPTEQDNASISDSDSDLESAEYSKTYGNNKNAHYQTCIFSCDKMDDLEEALSTCQDEANWTSIRVFYQAGLINGDDLNKILSTRYPNLSLTLVGVLQIGNIYKQGTIGFLISKD